MTPTDVRILDVSFSFEEHRYRAPLKFGGVVSDRVTLLNAAVAVEARDGRVGRGFGSMPLGNAWAFPSRRVPPDRTLAAMQGVAARAARRLADHPDAGHPVEIAHALEPAWLAAGAEVTAELGLEEPVPPLAALVASSPFDAALHDAYGKLLGLNCYRTYGPDLLRPDLGRFLGPDFAGDTLDRHVTPGPRDRMPLYHLVGALDPLTPAEVARPIGDGGPETLADWIRADGLTHLKVKLDGNDLAWDVGRVLAVEAVAAEARGDRGPAWAYSLDFNERCPDVEYLLDFLARLRERSPAAFDRVQYVEQPTARDLEANPGDAMHAAARIKPVVIDESLLGLESLLLARELGYNGVALKACKGQTQSLLMAAAARRHGLFLCVQDLTCPGASLVQSAGLAAHVVGVAAIEANARQYVPAANRGWDERFPGLFRITDGTAHTGQLTGPGLGAVP